MADDTVLPGANADTVLPDADADADTLLPDANIDTIPPDADTFLPGADTNPPPSLPSPSCPPPPSSSPPPSSTISSPPPLSSSPTPPPDSTAQPPNSTTDSILTLPPPAKKTKKKSKSISVWTKPTSRKGKKKPKTPIPAPSSVGPHRGSVTAAAGATDTVLMAPAPRLADRSDDTPDATIALSRIHKAEKVDVSDDRLTAASTKGYRMVRATRGVQGGAWYFEIKILRLGDTGHTRIGWTTDKGDLQAPVGYDGHSFGYRDIDGSKVHKALREKYGEGGYGVGDVIGFYINLPDGEMYAPKPPHLVWYKGVRYVYPADGKDEPPKVVPGEFL